MQSIKKCLESLQKKTKKMAIITFGDQGGEVRLHECPYSYLQFQKSVFTER